MGVSCELFQRFTGRDEQLRGIPRYSGEPLMFYRTNDLVHSQRVAAMACDLRSLFLHYFPEEDPHLLEILAHVHDDIEMKTGDIQANVKERMTRDQICALKVEERAGIVGLQREYPAEICVQNGVVTPYNYRRLLVMSTTKRSRAAQFVSYLDKLDAGIGESRHEIYAGNVDFVPICYNYVKRIGELRNKFTCLAPLFDCDHPLLKNVEALDFEMIARKGAVHSVTSVYDSTGDVHYDYWKALTLSHFGDEGVRYLTEQKEFTPATEPRRLEVVD